MPVSPEVFKKLLGSFASGVTVVTVKNQESVHGLTVSAFSAVSLEPPLILVCIDKNTSSHEVLSQADAFVVNILGQDQADLALRFANSGLDHEARFAETDYRLSDAGIPILAEVVAYIECRKVSSFEAGDHSIFIGSVVGGEHFDACKPMIYYRGGFHEI